MTAGEQEFSFRLEGHTKDPIILLCCISIRAAVDKTMETGTRMHSMASAN